MKASRLSHALLGLALLASCAPQIPFAPVNRAATVGQMSSGAQVATNPNLADNFSAWIRQKQREEGFTGEYPPMPIEGQSVAQLPPAGAFFGAPLKA